MFSGWILFKKRKKIYTFFFLFASSSHCRVGGMLHPLLLNTGISKLHRLWSLESLQRLLHRPSLQRLLHRPSLQRLLGRHSLRWLLGRHSLRWLLGRHSLRRLLSLLWQHWLLH